mgnify:CR=1 FL=1
MRQVVENKVLMTAYVLELQQAKRSNFSLSRKKLHYFQCLLSLKIKFINQAPEYYLSEHVSEEKSPHRNA